jgi:hypothetical protein
VGAPRGSHARPQQQAMLSHRQAALDVWQVQRAAAFGGLCFELNLNWKEQDGRRPGTLPLGSRRWDSLPFLSL